MTRIHTSGRANTAWLDSIIESGLDDNGCLTMMVERPGDGPEPGDLRKIPFERQYVGCWVNGEDISLENIQWGCQLTFWSARGDKMFLMDVTGTGYPKDTVLFSSGTLSLVLD